MTTLKHSSRSVGTLGSRSLRRLAVVGMIVPLIAVTGCSTDSPATTDVGATTQSTAPASATTDVPSPTPTTATPAPSQTNRPLKLSVEDKQLGHTVNVQQIARNVRWPGGAPVGKATFEIVGVKVSVTAGSRYSATVEPKMFTLQAGKSETAPATSEFGKKLGTPLTVAKRGETKQGWLFFKITRGTSGPLTLILTRPAYKISTTGKSFPAKNFSVKIDG